MMTTKCEEMVIPQHVAAVATTSCRVGGRGKGEVGRVSMQGRKKWRACVFMITTKYEQMVIPQHVAAVATTSCKVGEG